MFLLGLILLIVGLIFLAFIIAELCVGYRESVLVIVIECVVDVIFLGFGILLVVM